MTVYYCPICRIQVPTPQVDPQRMVHQVQQAASPCKTCPGRVTAHRVVQQEWQEPQA